MASNHNLDEETMMLEERVTLPDSESVRLCGQSSSPMVTESLQSLDDGNLKPDKWSLTNLMGNSYSPYNGEENARYLSERAKAIKDKYQKKKVTQIQRAGLILKTPIAYQKDTDPNILPIQKDGMAVCKRCGAMGVKHAFYTKERDFCSTGCAQKYAREYKKGEPMLDPLPILDYPPKRRSNEGKVWGRKYKSREDLSASKMAEKEPGEKKPRRKNNVSALDSYDWKSQLRSPSFYAAPVTCFRHVPGASCWEDITGRKVEVENTDCHESSDLFPNSFWVATVLRVCGYYCQLRYEGFGGNSSKDFWLNLCVPCVHSVGWCAMRGNPLIPPKTIEHKHTDWKGYLHKQLTGAETLSLNFHAKIEESRECRFKPRMNVELVDKTCISQVKMATVSRVTGKRLVLTYYDSDDDQHGFHCHEDSPLLHYVGWAREVDAQIDAPRDYLLRCETEDYDEHDATKEYFCDRRLPIPNLPADCAFKKGMKLEAIDPLNLSTICVATVMKVLLDGYVMIRIDSYDEDPTNSDWFCYHSSSTCIFPAGFCDVNDIYLTPPKGYRPGKFKWTEYLAETGFETAPIALFNRELPDHGFKVGMRLEAADLMDPKLVCGAMVSRVVHRLLKVHFDGWEDEYDQWLDCESPDIYPVGWCDVVGHKLEKPGPPATKCQGVAGKAIVKQQKKTRRRSRKGKNSPDNPPVSQKPKPNTPPSAGRGLRKLQPMQPGNEENGALNEPTVTPPASLLRSRRPARKGASVQPAKTRRQTSVNLPSISVPENNNNSANEEVPEARTNLDSDMNNYELAYMPTSKMQDQKEKNPKQVENDKTVPVASEPKEAPGKPNEPTGTSHETSIGVSTKLNPCLDSNGMGSERGGLLPDQWTAINVAEFLIVNDCKTYSNNFIKENIDGKTFLGLTKDDVVKLTDMKVGPSLKIYALIEQLKLKVSPGRIKTFNMKVSSKLQPPEK